MSTRCNIIVTKTTAYAPSATGRENPNNGLKTTQLYHHHDGYPTGVGLELAQAVLAMHPGPDDLKSDLEVRRQFVEKLPREYEIESGTYHDQFASLHGDIEWVYHLDFDNGVTLTAYKRPGFSTPVPDDDSWKAWPRLEMLRLDLRKYGPKTYWNLRHLTVRDGDLDSTALALEDFASCAPEPTLLIQYEHCGTSWEDEWTSACDGECPVCGCDIEAKSWEIIA